VRDAENRGVWMKSPGFGFEEMTPELLVLLDESGNTPAGSGRRHIEYPIHTEIMRARPDVNAVVRTHWPQVVAFAATEMQLRPMGSVLPTLRRDGQPGLSVSPATSRRAVLHPRKHRGRMGVPVAPDGEGPACSVAGP
jgi:hypothetical protein